MPSFTENFFIEDLDLSANNLGDEYAYMINKVLASHLEHKDELVW